jgi:hypothetical protein
MDLILLDWTRMGRSYCLAGAVADDGGYRVVRPILRKFRDAPVRNVGGSAYLLDGHQRWEVFEIVGPVPTPPDPPHVEDLWVRALQPRHCLATREQRQAILTATQVPRCARGWVNGVLPRSSFPARKSRFRVRTAAAPSRTTA